jgi:hypothetical protein
MFFFIHVLFIISTSLSAIAMRSFPGSTPHRHTNAIATATKDCIIVPIKGRTGCLEPERCRDAGGLCIFVQESWRVQSCEQAVVDEKEPLGYRIERWRSHTMPLDICWWCGDCQCLRPSTDSSPNFSDEERTPKPAMPKEAQHLAGWNAPTASRRVWNKYHNELKDTSEQIQTRHSASSEDEESASNRAMAAGSARLKRQRTSPNSAVELGSLGGSDLGLSPWNFPSRDPLADLENEERTSSRELSQKPPNLAESEPGPHMLLHNPTYIDPNL